MKHLKLHGRKVALLYFGLPRFTFFGELMKSHLEKISSTPVLPKVNIDCFAALWDVKAVKEMASPWAKFHSDPIGENYKQDFCRNWNDAEINWLESSATQSPEYSKKLIEILTNRFPISTSQTSLTAVEVLLSHMYSLKVGSDMIQSYCQKTGTKFDFVITLRTDLMINKKICVNTLERDYVHISKQHERFPDNLIIYPFALLDAISCFDNILDIACRVKYPVAESFKLAQLEEINPQFKVKSHNWSLELFRGEAHL